MNNKTYFIETYGCQRHGSATQVGGRILLDSGLREASAGEGETIYKTYAVVNGRRIPVYSNIRPASDDHEVATAPKRQPQSSLGLRADGAGLGDEGDARRGSLAGPNNRGAPKPSASRTSQAYQLK